MDHFNDLKLTGRNKVEIGPGVTVKDAAIFLRDNKLFLPHGECPLIKFGGHVQTGGYGLFRRSFGLTADYVTAFDIILANGEHRTILRPKLYTKNLNKKQLYDLKLFRGVLGGNAGSFGIVTKYYFEVIKDEDHPNSWAFSKVRFYT
jgi:FAD/FMN-containing dehydrogenase